MIDKILNNKNSKATLHQLQKLCGFLNFLCKCVVPGRAFTRRLYTLTSNEQGKLMPHHHIRLNAEMKRDLQTWKQFLLHPTVYCRKFADFTRVVTAYEVNFASDTSGVIGMGALCKTHWMCALWDQESIQQENPSIEYLELFALVAAALAWLHLFRNHKIIIYCDNQTVCRWVNQSTTSCRNSMVLIRKLIFKCMTENVTVFAQYLESGKNKFADAISRDKISLFKQLAAEDGLEVD